MIITTLTRKEFKNRKKASSFYGRCPICLSYLLLESQTIVTPVVRHAQKEHPYLYLSWVVSGDLNWHQDVIVKRGDEMLTSNLIIPE